MKKIISFLVFFPFLINAQSLEYNRTIDTVLSLTVPAGTVFNTSSNKQIVGDYISAPSNKVWKVQSIIIICPNDKNQNGNKPIQYGNSSNYADGSFTEISGKIALMIKNNGFENNLFSKNIESSPQNFEQVYNSPIWINNSELGIAFIHNANMSSSYNIYLNNSYGSYTGYIHLSIIEFNTN